MVDFEPDEIESAEEACRNEKRFGEGDCFAEDGNECVLSDTSLVSLGRYTCQLDNEVCRPVRRENEKPFPVAQCHRRARGSYLMAFLALLCTIVLGALLHIFVSQKEEQFHLDVASSRGLI